MIKKHVPATFPEGDGGMAAGNLGRSESNVVVPFPTDGERGGELHDLVILGILANNYTGHDTTKSTCFYRLKSMVMDNNICYSTFEPLRKKEDRADSRMVQA
jgi:hypothetical protein